MNRHVANDLEQGDSIPEPCPADRRRRAALAGHQGNAHAALAFLLDDDPTTRAAALSALERLSSLDDEALAAGLTDPDPSVRRRAAQLAARHPEIELVASLGDADPSVAEMAAWALGERNPSAESIAALSTLATSHRDALCREAAVAALGALGDPAGLAAILAGTEDKPAIRRRAVLALAPFDGPEVDEALQRALTDRDWQVRQAAEDLLS